MPRPNAFAPLLALPLALLALAACQSTPHRVHADAASASAMFDPIAQLAGDWEGEEAGEAALASHFELTGAGSAVCETMFPGQPHQMTNLYHLDGDRVVLTHYCAIGNQPRMVATDARQTDAGLVYDFNFESVTNLRPEHEAYMGQMTLTIAPDGSVQQAWRSYERDGTLTPPLTMVLHRK